MEALRHRHPLRSPERLPQPSPSSPRRHRSRRKWGHTQPWQATRSRHPVSPCRPSPRHPALACRACRAHPAHPACPRRQRKRRCRILPTRTSRLRRPVRSAPRHPRPAWLMPVPRIRLLPSRPPPCRPSSPPTACHDIRPATGAGLEAQKRPRSRRQPPHRRPPMALRRTRALPLRQPPLRLVLRPRPLRPQHRRLLACFSRRPSRCGGPTRATGRAAPPAIGPAARFWQTSPRRRRRPCEPLPTRNRWVRFSSDRFSSDRFSSDRFSSDRPAVVELRA